MGLNQIEENHFSAIAASFNLALKLDYAKIFSHDMIPISHASHHL